MKRILFIINFILFGFLCCAQNNINTNDEGNVYYSEIINIDSNLTGEDVFRNFELWFSAKNSRFNRKNKATSNWSANKADFADVDNLYNIKTPLVFSNKETGIITGKCNYRFEGSKAGCIRLLYISYDIKISIKEDRYRYEIKNFYFNHYNLVTKSEQPTHPRCGQQGQLRQLIFCDRCKYELEILSKYFTNDIQNLVEDLKNSAFIIEDNW